jgi:hypothetical protein
MYGTTSLIKWSAVAASVTCLSCSCASVPAPTAVSAAPAATSECEVEHEEVSTAQLRAQGMTAQAANYAAHIIEYER